jgi:DUF1365 family protein
MADILTTQVFHARTRPKRNAFRYSVCYLRIGLAELSRPTGCSLFSIDRFNLFSLHNKDYRPKDHRGPLGVEEAVRRDLDEFGLSEADGDIDLITLPRILGYAFNPVSFFLCHDGHGQLRAVIAAVNNTFGEHHRYVCFHDDHRPIKADDWLEARKIFHVSPFLAVAGTYRFRFATTGGNLAVWINHHDAEGLLLSTSLIGRAEELTSKRLFSCFFRYPLMTLKVIALIHYQAVKLFLKGMRHYHKPAPPVTGVSR